MCIFCRIVSGEVPAKKVYEDDYVVAFLDIAPLTEGHVLLVTKEHKKTLWDFDADTIGVIFATSKKVVDGMKNALKPERVMVAVLGTDVPHVHVHLVPRYPGDGHGSAIDFSRHLETSPEKLEKTKELIASKIS